MNQMSAIFINVESRSTPITHKSLIDLGFKCQLIEGTDKAGYLDYSFGEYPGRGYVNIFRAVDVGKYVCTTHYEVFCPESMEDVKRLCAL